MIDKTQLEKAVEYVIAGAMLGAYRAGQRGAHVILDKDHGFVFEGELEVTPNATYLKSLTLQPEVVSTSADNQPEVVTTTQRNSPDKVTETIDQQAAGRQVSTENDPEVVQTEVSGVVTSTSTTSHPTTNQATTNSGGGTSDTHHEYHEFTE